MPTTLRRTSAAVAAAGVLAASALTAAPAYANSPANCYAHPTKALVHSRLSAAVYCTDGEWLGVHDDQARRVQRSRGPSALPKPGRPLVRRPRVLRRHHGRHYQGWSFCNFSVTDGTLVRIRLWSSKNGVESYPVVAGSFTT
jgi:hypothetical protein